MSLRVTCVCGKAFRAPPALAGKTVKCPACGSPIAIPLEDQTALNAELVPLASNDPLTGDSYAAGAGHDPLGVGNFDERNAAPSHMRPMPTYGQPQQPRQSSNQALTIGLIVGGLVLGGLMVIGVLVALLVPAVQAARKAAQRVQEQNARGIVVDEIPPLSTNPYADGDSNSIPTNALMTRTEIPQFNQWIPYESPEGYSVLFPTRPRTISANEQGKQISITTCDFGPKGRYTVVVARVGRENALKSLEGNVGIEGPGEGDVQSESKIELNGHPGREVNLKRTVAGLQMNIQARYYAVDDVLYEVAFQGFNEPGVSVPEFLNSFKLTK